MEKVGVHAAKQYVMSRHALSAALLLWTGWTPSVSMACACGCDIFDVGAFASGSGGTAFLEYDVLDQKVNRSQSAKAPESQNPDKEIKTSFYTAGARYMFDRSWGVEIAVPYWQRHFKTTTDDGSTDAHDHGALGDTRIKGLYTGLSEDMSTGVSYGLKLPTGDSSYAHFDPDTEIGPGSYDLLLGIYHLSRLTSDNTWVWYSQLNIDQPIVTKVNYIPGNEINAAIGLHYNGWTFSTSSKVAPVMALLAAIRGNDNGNQSNSASSGYKRLLVAPGLEVDLNRFRFFGGADVPVYEYYYGNQLASTVAYKVMTSFDF